ncbi:hypothetical protein EG328_010580 [Venturia inaequalis]|nr:hypothetical protein EG328_010580 [Venturia inaequalis]RDI84704.1 hypothetical protein Vi05172_g5234 [Venturia inaequalis]
MEDDNRPPPPWVPNGANPPWPNQIRPLSDIREITEPSLADLTNRYHNRRPSLKRNGSLSRQNSSSRKDSLSRHPSWKGSIKAGTQNIIEEEHRTIPTCEQTDQSSDYSGPLDNVPRRVPSQGRRSRERNASVLRRQPSVPAAAPRGLGYTIPNRGQSVSPVKEAIGRSDPIYYDLLRRQPSRTFARSIEPNYDILDFPKHQHPRISAELHVGASLFVGGGSIEGHVRVVVDHCERSRHRRQLALSRVSVDLLGVEEMSTSRRNVFLNLATELVDSDNPPPHNMVESLKQLSPLDPFWMLAASNSNLPFLLSLPLDVGPPPFYSKHARIRYILAVTLLVRDQGKQYLVRASQEVSVLSVYDPEKALMSLPSPLTASDEYIRHRDSGMETIKVTAGLHRQVWVSGTNIFVDVHIANNSKKVVKRVELQLERDILFYKHVAATTKERSASQARIFDNNERTILSKGSLKSGSCGWNGISAHTSDMRTCDLELPRGHATVKCGKFFEVRYFLNVIVSASHSKLITVQLPIVLIHMNSLDVVPNSVAQVAAAIEEKRAKSHQRSQSRQPRPPGALPTNDAHVLPHPGSPTNMTRRPSNASVQGRAFAAPRKQSLDRVRSEAEELFALGKLLDTSPRKYHYSPRQRAIASTHKARKGSQSEITYGYQTPPSNRKARILSDEMGEEVEDIRNRLRRMRSNETNRSIISTRNQDPVSGSAVVRRGNSLGSRSQRVGFRDLEKAEVASGSPGANNLNMSRFESLSAAAGRTAHTQTHSHTGQLKKMKSVERWRGPSWFSERRERSRDREDREKMMGNWI